jgi:hypothetical protein
MLSTTIAIPCTPPIQAVADPHFFRRFRIIMQRLGSLTAKCADTRIDVYDSKIKTLD